MAYGHGELFVQILFLHFRIMGCYNKDTIRTKGNSKAPRMAVLGAFSTDLLLVVKPVTEKFNQNAYYQRSQYQLHDSFEQRVTHLLFEAAYIL